MKRAVIEILASVALVYGVLLTLWWVFVGK